MTPIKTFYLTLFAIAIISCSFISACFSYDVAHDLVFKTIYAEACSGGAQGMLAVAEVIRNRAERDNITPTQVVMAPKQFSFWNKPKVAAAWLRRNYNRGAQREAREAYFKSFFMNTNTTNGATHFHSERTNVYWHDALIHTASVGGQCFHRED